MTTHQHLAKLVSELCIADINALLTITDAHSDLNTIADADPKMIERAIGILLVLKAIEHEEE